MKNIILAMLFSLSLTACSGGPGNSDIESAFRADRGIGQSASIDIISVDNMKETGDGAYVSTVVLKIDSMFRGRRFLDTHTLLLTMREANGEWIIVDSKTIRHETVNP